MPYWVGMYNYYIILKRRIQLKYVKNNNDIESLTTELIIPYDSKNADTSVSNKCYETISISTYQ